jgi:hypothetical protein
MKMCQESWQLKRLQKNLGKISENLTMIPNIQLLNHLGKINILCKMTDPLPTENVYFWQKRLKITRVGIYVERSNVEIA